MVGLGSLRVGNKSNETRLGMIPLDEEQGVWSWRNSGGLVPGMEVWPSYSTDIVYFHYYPSPEEVEKHFANSPIVGDI